MWETEFLLKITTARGFFMKKISRYLPMLLFIVLTLSGCNVIGEKSMSISSVYAATTVLSLLILITYCFFVEKKDNWFLLLFSSVFVIDAGYFTLSISGALEEALLANRIAYLGSVLLPLSMLMLIWKYCNLRYRKWVSLFLLCTSITVFLIAASPGYSDVYYKSVSLSFIDNVAVLDKVYGSLHSVYLYYLIAYFAIMICVIAYATVRRKIKSNMQVVILLISVFVNIGVWLIEQLIDIHFEFLSVSYIVTELFLMCVSLLENQTVTVPAQADNNVNLPADITETVHTQIENSACAQNNREIIIDERTEIKKSPAPSNSEEEIFRQKCEYFRSQFEMLTPTEKMVYSLYVEKKSTKEVLEILNIKENTLKYHNKNIYSKLGVSSRKQLLEFAAAVNCKSISAQQIAEVNTEITE